MNYAASSSGASHSRFTPSKSPFTPSRAGTSIQDLAPKAKFTSLVIRGRIHNNSKEVKLRIYGKMSVPAGHPQHTFSLFPESGTSLKAYIIHPLNASGVPYAHPKLQARDPAASLLRNASRALNLPKPLPDQYIDVLDQQLDLPDALRAMARLGGDRETLSKAVHGTITVVNYMTTFITPKFTMPAPSAIGMSSPSVRTPGRKSLTTKAVAQYMIAMEVLAPISGGSAESPFMLNLPIPECLDNRIKLYLPPAPQPGEWTILTHPRVNPDSRDPLIARGASSESADDEADPPGEGAIEGTFQCESNSLVIRWSSNPGTSGKAAQRKLVSVAKVTSEATYVIHPMEMEEQRPVDGDSTIRVQKYIPMDIEWVGTCLGLSHPGVETSLAVEVLLDGRHRGVEVEWGNPATEAHGRVPTGSWDVSGGLGFNGFDRVPSGEAEPHRREMSSSPTPSGPSNASIHSALSRRPTQLSEDSSPNTSIRVYGGSLLRTPLPGLDVDEYSFETAQTDPEDHSPVTPGRRTTSSGVISRESSGPSASSVLTPSSSAIGRVSASEALGASSGSEASLSISTPMSMSDFTGTSASPRRPRSLSRAAHATPCDPIHLRVNLMHLIQQGGFDPKTATMEFTLKTRLNILVPEGQDEKEVTVPLPTIRLPRAKEHLCEFSIRSSGTSPIDILAPGKTKQVFPGDSFESGVTPVSPAIAPRDSAVTGISLRIRNIRIPEVASSNLTVHDVEPLALVMPSPHGSFDVTPTGPHRQRPIDFSKSSISCVEITTTPQPPSLPAPLTPTSPAPWAQLSVMKAPWPSAADSNDFLPSIEFGFPASIEGILEVRSAHVGGRIAPFRVYPNLSGSGGRLPTIFEKTQEQEDWSYWVKVHLPPDLERTGGEIQFVYVITKEVVSRSSAELVMTIPGFSIDVAILRVGFESLEGYTFKAIRSDIAARDANAGTFGTASVPRRSPRQLRYSLSKPVLGKAALKSFSYLSKASLFLVLAFILFDQQSMRAELGLTPVTHRITYLFNRQPPSSISSHHLPTSTITPVTTTTLYRPPVETIPGAPEDIWDDLGDEPQQPIPSPQSEDSESSSLVLDVSHWLFTVPGALGLGNGEHRARVLYLTKIWLWKVVHLINAVWNYPS